MCLQVTTPVLVSLITLPSDRPSTILHSNVIVSKEVGPSTIIELALLSHEDYVLELCFGQRKHTLNVLE